MRICVICGSNRTRSNSAKVAGHVRSLLLAQDPSLAVDLLELAGSALPLWTEAAWDATSGVHTIWEGYARRLREADGLVIVAPEWNGTVPPALTNFFMYTSRAELAHKPGLLVSVSSGAGGAYPIAELRMSAYKNNRLCLIPEHVIVRQADQVLLDPRQPASPHDAEVRSRLENGLRVLLAYTESLAEMRRKHGFDFERHPYGM